MSSDSSEELGKVNQSRKYIIGLIVTSVKWRLIRRNKGVPREPRMDSSSKNLEPHEIIEVPSLPNEGSQNPKLNDEGLVLGTKYQYSIEKPQNKYSTP
jgi:hypothetical protein